MPFKAFQRFIAALRHARYPGSLAYWERRYAGGGHSGSGSSGRLARYKAEVVNQFILKQQIQSIVELGCGDGQQLQLGQYPEYTGFDISPSAVQRCRKVFRQHPSLRFEVYEPETFIPAGHRADMSLSLEVLFHITEDHLYKRYMEHLFALARRYVVVFAPNEADTTGGYFPHVKFREFTRDVPPGWVLRDRLVNPHRDLSFSDFFFFEKAG